jgi:hypothetical protein
MANSTFLQQLKRHYNLMKVSDDVVVLTIVYPDGAITRKYPDPASALLALEAVRENHPIHIGYDRKSKQTTVLNALKWFKKLI